ncbi:MAG TPA: RNA polymerase sigma factor [Chitinophagaceae bacterium]|nr:RNA polymerase sigma factor [Chitinophagaceae bacterium]
MANWESNHLVSETDLIQGCIEGNRRMQEILYQRFSPKMYGVCLRYAGSANDAQDLLQEGFIKVYNSLSKFRGEGSFEGWLRRIFVNTAIEHFRRKVNLRKIQEIEHTNIEDRSLTALDHLGEKDILNLIMDLSPGYRTVFNLYVIEGYSHKEIAEMMGISEGTSKSQLARAKNILRDLVKTKLDNNNIDKPDE